MLTICACCAIYTNYTKYTTRIIKTVEEEDMNMVDNLSNSLLPSESEIREIIVQMMQTNPTQIPVVLLQIQFARLMLKTIDKLRKDLETSVKQLEDTIYGNK